MEKTNKIIYDLSTGVVMLQSNTTGETTSGNGFVNGNFGATTLVAQTALRGGTISTPNTLNISSAVSIANTLSVANGITGDLTGTANNASNLNGQNAAYYTNATNLDSGTVPAARLPSANSTAQGAVIIIDSVANTSISHAPTANAVKTAYDAAGAAYTNAVAFAANATNISSGTVAAARLPSANTTVQGAVQLVDSVSNTSVTLAATANAVKTADDHAANASYLSSGTVPTARLPASNTTQSGVVQLVDSYQNTSTSLAPTAKALSDFYTLYSTSTIPPSNLPAANTTQAGIVQLVDSVSNTSVTIAPTANATKTAYDAAISANTLAANAHVAAANASYLSQGTVPNARLNTANTTAAGIVQLSDSLASTSIVLAATANAVKTAYDTAAAAASSASAAYSNAVTFAANATNLSNGTVASARLPAANTTQAGIVQLVDSVSNTSITIAATANAVKTANDNAANATFLSSGTVANARLNAANTTQAGIVQLVDSVSNTSITIAPTANAVKTANDNAANATFLSSGTVANARLNAANTTQAGIVQLVDSVSNTSITIAATANAVKTANDNAANATFLSSGTVAAARLPAANTTQSGIVQLVDSATNTSTTIAPTANALYAVYQNVPKFTVTPQNASYTIAAADVLLQTMLTFSNATANVYTLANNATQNIPTGGSFVVRVKAGSANLAVNRATGVTINKAGATANTDITIQAGGLVTFIQEANNTWIATGSGMA